MGKHRHKKSFYDVDEEELKSSQKHRHHHHHHKHEQSKKRVSSPPSFYHISRSDDDDEAALLSPPVKRTRSSPQTSQSSLTMLSQLIENPEFLANAGPKAKEFAETARQLLAKPDLDPMTQQIICAMAQAAVNVGKRLGSSSSSSSTPVDQCVDEISVTNSTTFSSTALLSPSLSNASSSSTSTTPQQQSHHSNPLEDHRLTTNESETDEDILIKQMVERAMKLTEQGDTKQAQHLLGIIREKISKKRKSTTSITHEDDPPVSNDFYASSISSNESFYYSKRSPSIESESLNDPSGTPNSIYPPPPPLPPPPPPPPSSVPVPPIEQVQELLSNPSELQDILKKLFGANDTPKVLPPEELQNQSHLTSPPSSFHVQNNMHYPHSSRLNPPGTSIRGATPALATSSQPYNSSLAFMQGNRRNLPPLQAPDRCFSSSNQKSSTKSTSQTINRSFSASSSSTTSIPPAAATAGVTTPLTHAPLSAPPLMKVNPTFPLTSAPSTPVEPIPSRWSTVHEPPSYYVSNHPIGYETNPNLHHEPIRTYQPFRCATCALEFPHQIAYQDHLRSHVPCTVPGCSYAATETLVRIHHQNIHDNNARNRLSSTSARSMLYQQSSSSSTVDPGWPLMRM